MRDERSVGSAVTVVGAVLGVIMSAVGYVGFAGLTDVVAPPKLPTVSTVRPGGLTTFGTVVKKEVDLEREWHDRSGDAYYLLLVLALGLGVGMAATVLPKDMRGVFLFPFLGLSLPGNVWGIGTVMMGMLFRQS